MDTRELTLANDIYNRLLPDGIETHRFLKSGEEIRLRYVDANDVPDGMARTLKMIINVDSNPHINNGSHIPKGSEQGKRYRVVVLKNWEFVMIYTFKEILDSPFGYGEGDFLMLKYVALPYRNSKFGRFASSDLYHMLFRSGLMKKIYSIAKIKEDGKGADSPLKLIDTEVTPCHSIVYPSDHENIQKYISMPFTVHTEKGLYGVFEADGEIYNAMDVLGYYRAARAESEKDEPEDTARIDLLRTLDGIAERLKGERHDQEPDDRPLSVQPLQ